MPHSSGGGSHGGGSHGGGGFHGGSGGHSGPRTYHSYRPGYRTFVYYRHRHPYYVYSDGDLSQTTGGKIFASLIILLFICVFGFAIYSTISPASKLENTDKYSIVIDDNADVINEDSLELNKALSEFKEQTGITPAIFTCYDSDWNENYNTLYNYGYNLYVNNFKDETHWVIVYSVPEGTDTFDWSWEAIQGNYTDSILTESKCNDYVDIIQRCLTADAMYTDTEAFTQAFNEINEDVMSIHFDSSIIMMILVEIFLIVVFFGVLFQDKVRGYKASDLKEVKTNIDSGSGKPKEKNCEYCGGLYVVGMHESCPHCGATILAEDYDEKK